MAKGRMAAGLLALVSAAGCGGASGDGGGDDTGCASWKIESGSEYGTAELADSALVLRTAGLPVRSSNTSPFNGLDLAFSQEGLTGDFDVTISWEELRTGGGLWSRIEGGVWFDDPNSGNGYVYQVVGDIGGSGGMAVVVNQPADFLLDSFVGPSAATFEDASGSFHIVRTATGATSTTTMKNGMTATSRSTTPLPDVSYTLFIGIGIGPFSYDEDEHDEASIRITGVTVSGGGGTVKSDDFSCGTLDLAAGTLTPT